MLTPFVKKLDHTLAGMRSIASEPLNGITEGRHSLMHHLSYCVLIQNVLAFQSLANCTCPAMNVGLYENVPH